MTEFPNQKFKWIREAGINECALCRHEFLGLTELLKHIRNSHNISKEKYWRLSTIHEEGRFSASGICVCGKKKPFLGIYEGYAKSCKNCDGRSRTMEESLNPERFFKVEKIPYSRKKRIEVDNTILIVSGWEANFLRDIYKYGISPKDVTTDVPVVKYYHKHKIRRYTADFYIRRKSLLVEVKSDWTYNSDPWGVDRKLKSARDAGFNTLLVVYENKDSQEPRIFEVKKAKVNCREEQRENA